MNPDNFANLLLNWSYENQRDLPWKKDRDPYKIWISEIILQQTRVEQGTPYFNKFIATFPNIESLANADENDVLKLWEGLGYYSRARNLHHSAKFILDKMHGVFPQEYDEIIKLKGIGPYSAAAIASFAFGKQHAVVDGNVLRLISRILGIKTAVDTKPTQIEIAAFVNKGIKKVEPAHFNQALMDFGSSVCTPLNPVCKRCPLQEYCVANTNDEVRMIPVKSKKILKKDRFFHFFDIELPQGFTLICQRQKTDIWKKLFQLPLLESNSNLAPNRKEIKTFIKGLINMEIKRLSFTKSFYGKQMLTHQQVYGHFYKIKLTRLPEKINQDQYLVERTKVSNFAFPKIIAEYLKNPKNK